MPSSSRDGLCVTSTEAKARFKAVRLVAHKARPQVAARDQLAQVGHHLTAVAHAERQRLRTMEEGRELIAHALVEQNRLRPALARAQHVAVGEAAAGYQGMEIAQTGPAGQQVAHMHVDGVKAGTMEGGRHFNVGSSPLLAQDGHFRPRAGGNVRGGDVVVNIKRELHIEARVGIIGFRLMLPDRRRPGCRADAASAGVVSAHHMRSVVRLSLNTV